MLEKVKLGGLGFMVGLLVAAIAAHFCYDKGFDHGFAEAESQQADAVKIAQSEVKKDYEKRIQELSASIERLRDDNAQRLRELNDFSHARTDLATAVTDVNLQDWRCEVKSYSDELTRILKRSNEK